jgi:hypothetical protein
MGTDGRTLDIWERVYMDGLDVSGYLHDLGDQDVTFPEAVYPAAADLISGVLLKKPVVTLGDFNGILDPTTAVSLHALCSAAGGNSHKVMVAKGMRGEPVMGNHVFCGVFDQKSYKANGKDVVQANVGFSGWDLLNTINYTRFWGNLLHAKAAETAANSANTNVNNLAATTAGGWLMYQIQTFGGTGSATISIDDSANGTNWLALSGATSGAIAHTSMPCAGIVQLATNATVRQYLRWQLALNTLTSVTFTLAFIRG